MNDPITWQEITVTLGDIVPWAENPRYSTKAEARRILKSLDQFGQAKPINLSPTNDLYDGHQRLSALLTIKGNGHKIKAWQSSRHLTAEERKQFVLSLHEGAVGQWNFEELGNWEPELLATYGFDTDALDQTRREMAFLIEMLGEGFTEGEGENDPYEEWEGMPEFENEDNFGAVQSVKVHFSSQESIDRFSELVGQQITEKTVYIWFPKQDNLDLKSLRVKNES